MSPDERQAHAQLIQAVRGFIEAVGPLLERFEKESTRELEEALAVQVAKAQPPRPPSPPGVDSVVTLEP